MRRSSPSPAPANLPPGLAGRIHDELVASINAPNVRKTLEDNGFDIVASTPEEYGENIRREEGKWDAVIKKLGLTVN